MPNSLASLIVCASAFVLVASPAATVQSRTVVEHSDSNGGGPGPFAAPEIAEARLSNNIPVFVVQTSEVSTATLTMVFPGGSKTDPKRIAGVAQLAAALADRGLNGVDGKSIAARFQSLGVTFSATTTSDGTTFSLSAPSANIAAAGELAASVIKGAIYPEDDFERERQRALDAFGAAMTDPAEIARRAIHAVMYGEARYGTQPGGTPETLWNITRDDLLWHRQIYFHPARMRMVISGGLAPDEAIAIAEEMFGAWASPMPVGPVPRDAASNAPQPRTVVIDLPGAEYAVVYAAVRAPSRSSADYYPLTLANAVLGSGLGGRLFEEVGIKRSLSNDASSDFADLADGSILIASAQTPAQTADEVATIFLDEFARLGSESLSEELLEQRRLEIVGAYQRALGNSADFNALLADLLLQGIPPSETARIAERFAAVSPEAASAAARKYVDPERTTILIVGEAERFIDDLRAVREDIEVIPVSELELSFAALCRSDE